MRLFRSNLRVAFLLSGFVLLLAIIAAGCGGRYRRDSVVSNSAYTLTPAALGCSDSLDIDIKSGTFPAGSTVSFLNTETEQSISVNPISANGGTKLVCGFPEGSPSGEYDVVLNGEKIGTVDNACNPD